MLQRLVTFSSIILDYLTHRLQRDFIIVVNTVPGRNRAAAFRIRTGEV